MNPCICQLLRKYIDYFDDPLACYGIRCYDVRLRAICLFHANVGGGIVRDEAVGGSKLWSYLAQGRTRLNILGWKVMVLFG